MNAATVRVLASLPVVSIPSTAPAFGLYVMAMMGALPKPPKMPTRIAVR